MDDGILRLFIHKESLEVGKVLTHGDVLFLTAHKSSQSFRDSDVRADDRLHGVLEFGRVCSLQEYTFLTLFQLVFQRLIATGTVRIQDIFVGLVALSQRGADLVVTVSGTADEAVMRS